MEDTKRYKTPQYLGEPYRLIVFTLDEVFAAIITIYLVGSVCDLLVTSLFLAVFFLYLLRKAKGNEGPCFYVQIFYWYFSLSPKLAATPPSWIREYLG